MAFELYFSDKIDPNTVSIDARSGTLSQINTTTKKSSDHARSIINCVGFPHTLSGAAIFLSLFIYLYTRAKSL